MRTVSKIIILLTVCQIIAANDLATMENLGFSPDGKYFMFGQHVLRSQEGQARAELGIVDVEKNVYVGGGRKKGSWNVVMRPNQHSRGALYELIELQYGLKERYGINHLTQGKLLYTRENGDNNALTSAYGKEAESNSLSFRDFQKGREYTLTLNQDLRENGSKSSAAFYIDMNVKESSGADSDYIVGRKGYYRDNITFYKIVRIWAGPKGNSIVIVLSRKSDKDFIDYMIETLLVK